MPVEQSTPGESVHCSIRAVGGSFQAGGGEAKRQEVNRDQGEKEQGECDKSVTRGRWQ